MADKTVGELPRASTVTTTDLFVMEQAGQAKSLTGQVLINDLATALDGHGGINNIISNEDYTLTFALADGTEIVTEPVRGEKGDKGDRGTDGRAITNVELSSTSGLIDTYTVNFSDGTKTSFDVTNGSDIRSIVKTSTTGLIDTYTVTLTDGATSTFTVTNGNGIKSITLLSGTHTPGVSDIYQINYDNGEYTTFSVYNGMNGTGAVSSVNSITPDSAGDVALTAEDIPMSTETGDSILNEFNSFAEHTETNVANLAADIETVQTNLNGVVDSLGTAMDDIASRIGEVDDGAVDSATKIADGVVTRAKLATDALYSPVVWANSSRAFVASDLGKTIVNGGGNAVTYTLDGTDTSTFPISAEIAVAITGGGSVNIQFDNVAARLAGAGAVTEVTIAERYGMAALKKLTSGDNAFWLITGNVEVVT